MPDAVSRAGAVLAMLLMAACAPTTPDPPPVAVPPSAPASVASRAPVYGPMEFHQLGVCEVDCQSTGAIPVEHPKWGSIWLLTYTSGDPGGENESGLLAIGAGDRVLWRWKGGDWFDLAPAAPPSDRTGHLFVRYNPGRYDGLLVLAPTAGGFEDFGTLPSEADLPTSRFYSVVLVDGDGDGIFDIREDINDCDPNCAEGTHESVLHRWNGSDYRPD